MFEDQVYSRKELLEKREENLNQQQKIIYQLMSGESTDCKDL